MVAGWQDQVRDRRRRVGEERKQDDKSENPITASGCLGNKRPRGRVIRSLGKPLHSIRNLFEGVRLIRAPRIRNSNGSLPHEDGSDWHETLPKRVSDDLQLFIFRCRTKFVGRFFFCENFRGRIFFQENEVLEGL